jgi:hypothetical protein
LSRKQKIHRLVAKYIALRYAYSWISEPAESHYDSDFYFQIPENYLIDKSILNDEFTYDKRPCYTPEDEDIAIIKKEFQRLTLQIAKELDKCERKFNSIEQL